ncbi:hypothetical protein [Fimbriiglobus ruber]|uniref:Uncharacterized protein n=1 Tax=Fimbriiglobus ruber TaxID=1908690 RepID=A0A225DH44_9BACT|nr:hypothetical protein [Fimbriiglobus ruber]OWK40820.1 hypothetical protein FRUB_04712 [Fimbriiglobus ruber]
MVGRFALEEYHRGLKQATNVEWCQCLKAVAQRGHIGLAVRRSWWSSSGASGPV